MLMRQTGMQTGKNLCGFGFQDNCQQSTVNLVKHVV